MTVKRLLTVASLIGARRAVNAIRHLDVDDVLGIVGLERRSRWAEHLLPSLALAAVSAAIGAGTALLLAPTSGAELRRRLSSRAAEARERLSQTLGEHEGEEESEPEQTLHS